MLNNNKRGFTLIELAIVLVIIGILIGAIMQGNGILKNYRAAGVMAGIKQYQDAYEMFQQKYNAIPGDMVDAADVLDLPVEGTIFNGNGDGIISSNASGTREDISVWQHMALAGFIKGTYFINTVDDHFEPDFNIPKGPHKGAGYFMANFREVQLDMKTFSDQENYGDVVDTSNNYLVNSNTIFYSLYVDHFPKGILTPEEAYLLDVKMDDGIYKSGAFSGMTGLASTVPCGVDNGDGTWGYNVTNSGFQEGPYCVIFSVVEKKFRVFK